MDVDSCLRISDNLNLNGNLRVEEAVEGTELTILNQMRTVLDFLFLLMKESDKNCLNLSLLDV